jgi:hypothetical protein
MGQVTLDPCGSFPADFTPNPIILHANNIVSHEFRLVKFQETFASFLMSQFLHSLWNGNYGTYMLIKVWGIHKAPANKGVGPSECKSTGVGRCRRDCTLHDKCDSLAHAK